MAEVLMDFPQLSMTMPDGREESIMKRTTLVSLDGLGCRVSGIQMEWQMYTPDGQGEVP